MDPVTIRIQAEVAQALQQLSTLRQAYLNFTATYSRSIQEVSKTLNAISGDRVIRSAQQWIRVVEQVGGVTALTRKEQQQLNKVLEEAIAKYQALKRAVPTEFTKVASDLQRLSQAHRQAAEAARLHAVEEAKTARLSGMLGGQQAAATASRYLQVIQQIGGVTALTRREQEQANKAIGEYVQKLAALGQQAPKDLQAIHQQLQQVVKGHRDAANAAKQQAAQVSQQARMQQRELERIAQLQRQFGGREAISQAQRYATVLQQIGGTSRLTRNEQAQMNRVIDQGAQKMRALGQQVPRDWQNILNATKGATQETSHFFDSFFSRIAGGTAAGYVLASGMLKAFDMIRNGIRNTVEAVDFLIKRGGEVTNITRAFQTLSPAAGQDFGKTLSMTREVTQGLVADFKIMESANRAMLFGLHLTEEQFAKLMESSLVLGRAMNLGPERSIERIILALGRLSPRILDDLGIIVKLAEANEKWAKAHDKVVKQMTASERLLAFQEEALLKINEHVKNMGGLQLHLADRLQQVNVQWVNWRDQLAKATIESAVLYRAVERIQAFFAEAFGVESQGLIVAIVRLIEEAAIVSVKLGAVTAQLASNTIKHWGLARLVVLGFVDTVVNGVTKQLELIVALNNVIQRSGLSKVIPGAGGLDLAATASVIAIHKMREAQEGFRKDTLQSLETLYTFGSAADRMAKLLRVVGDQMEDNRGKTVAQLGSITSALRNNLEAGNGLEDQYDALGAVSESLEKRIARLNVQLTGAYKNGVDAWEIAQKHGAALKAISIEAEEMGVKLPAALRMALTEVQNLERLDDVAEAMKGIVDEIFGISDALGELADKQRELEWDDMMQSTARNLEMTADTVRETNEMVFQLEMGSWQQREMLIRQEAQKRRQELNVRGKYTKEALDAINKWEKKSLEVLEKDRQQALFEAQEEYVTFADIVGETLMEIPQMMSDIFIKGTGDVSRILEATFSQLGAKLGRMLFSSQSFGNALTQGVRKIFGTDFAAKFGALLGPIGEAVGSILGPLVGKMVDAFVQTTEEKLTKDLRRDWGVKISEELAKKIAEDAERMGDRYGATLLHLREIIEEAGGITAANVKQWIARARDLFVYIGRGMISTREAARELDEVFPMLAKQVTKTTGLASEELLELIHLTKQFKVESEEVFKFLNDNTQRVLKGFNALAQGITFAWLNNPEIEKAVGEVDKLNERAKELRGIVKELEGLKWLSGNQRVALRDAKRELAEIERNLGKATQALEDARKEAGLASSQETFTKATKLANLAVQAGLANGMQLLEVVQEMGPGLDELIKTQQTFGYEMDKTFGDLAQIRAFVKEHEQLAGTIGGINDMAVGLHNTSQLTQEGFEDLAAIALETLYQIRNEGLTAEQSLRLMQPTLQTLWELQQRHGFAIDETTQKLLGQAEAAGVVGEAFRSSEDRVVGALERVVEALERVADKMAGIAPGMLTAAEESVGPAKQIQESVDAISYGSSPGGLKDIPLKLAEARRAFGDFAKAVVPELEGVSSKINSLVPSNMLANAFFPRIGFGGGDPQKLVEELMARIGTPPTEGFRFADVLAGKVRPPVAATAAASEPGTVILPGAVTVQMLTLDEQEKVEQRFTRAMIRILDKNPGGEYSMMQDVAREMTSGY